MEHPKLSEHKLKKGTFVTPWNDALGDISHENSWFQNRLPEYLWIALILKKYGRDHGLQICLNLISELSRIDNDLVIPAFSQITKMTNEHQNHFCKIILNNIDKKVLSPLTAIFTQFDYPIFVNNFFDETASFEERFNMLITIMQDASDHQSHFSTDIRYVVLCYHVFSGKLRMPKETIDELMLYPQISHEDERMRYIRPSIRAAEIGLPLDILGVDNSDYLKKFWENVSKMSECKLMYIKYEDEPNDKNEYMQKLKSIMGYFRDLLATTPLDQKLTVILGIATYSYKRMLELVEHNLYNTITGRSIVRVLIEDYLMLKYLIKEEPTHTDIWKEFQYYGIGQYKLVLSRHREATDVTDDCHFNKNYIELLVNEFKDENFLNMDTRYFGKQPRQLAEYVDEQDLYGLYYDYDSAFEHGLWGAIRESSMLKCTSPMHQYHCVPDIDNHQNLKSVWHDCKMVMTKTLDFLDSNYGIPEHLKIEDTNA